MHTLFHPLHLPASAILPQTYIENPLYYEPQPIAILAMQDLQQYLRVQKDFEYHFGWEDDRSVGKMFGVLVVKDGLGNVGYLAAYSGKIFNHFDLAYFVPPVYNMFDETSFYVAGEQYTKSLNAEYIPLQSLQKERFCDERAARLLWIKKERQQVSQSLQAKLFDHYHIINQAGNYKSITEIFESQQITPKAGSGDCATIRLFQYAFQHQYQPLALGEFWWGADTPSKNRIHLQHYTACIEKCAPILNYMLSDKKNSLL